MDKERTSFLMLPDLFYTINFSLSIIASIIALTSIATILYYSLNLTSVIYGLHDNWAYHQSACAFHAYCYTTLCAAICYSYSIQAVSRL